MKPPSRRITTSSSIRPRCRPRFASGCARRTWCASARGLPRRSPLAEIARGDFGGHRLRCRTLCFWSAPFSTLLGSAGAPSGRYSPASVAPHNPNTMLFREPIPGQPARERLLDAAERLVLETGAGHLTLAAVAKFAGVSKGGLLYHFPSKDSLLEAMLARYLHDIDARVAARVG